VGSFEEREVEVQRNLVGLEKKVGECMSPLLGSKRNESERKKGAQRGKEMETGKGQGLAREKRKGILSPAIEQHVG
jgi:hypothetical protein